MSTRFESPPVYLEVPDFGYGPASAMLAMLDPIADRHQWHVVSTGRAARFVGRQLPHVKLHDVDTFTADRWDDFLSIAPPGAAVLSVTNPHFAGWAAAHGYRVGIVDTLDWMWARRPYGVDLARFHLVQSYFGMVPGHIGCEAIKPIIDTAVWSPAGRSAQAAPGTALVGFGGMTMPTQAEQTARYVQWFAAAALPALVEHGGCTEVTVVGGRADLADLLPPWWRRDRRVTVVPGTDRRTYAKLVQSTEHQVLAPGLGSIYECAAARLAPLFQPGFSMSMILQTRALRQAGYPHLATWGNISGISADLAGVSELTGLRRASEIIDRTVNDDPTGSAMADAVTDYLDRDPHQVLTLPAQPHLPDGRRLLADRLDRLL